MGNCILKINWVWVENKSEPIQLDQKLVKYNIDLK